jgi:hypothetical protein
MNISPDFTSGAGMEERWWVGNPPLYDYARGKTNKYVRGTLKRRTPNMKLGAFVSSII